MADDYKGNKHIPYNGEGDSTEAVTTPSEPIFVPKNKDGDLKNTLTGEDV